MSTHRKSTRSGVLAGAAALTMLAASAPAGVAQGSERAAGDHQRGGGPAVSLTAAVPGDSVAPGVGLPGVGSPDDGAGFVINVEAQSRGRAGIAVKEALNIRDTGKLGQRNPSFPGLVVTVDNELTTPDGSVIPAGTNLAALFNIAGTDDSRGAGSTVWAGWHVLESLAPGTRRLTVTASVTDLAGRTGTQRQTYTVSSRAGSSGQALTPAPGAAAPTPTGGRGPKLELSAPENPTSVAVGTLPQPNAGNGTLFFIQLDALDVAGHGIGVDENGAMNAGTIATPAVIPPGGKGADNPNAPGLHFSFDVPLLQPNRNRIDAGQNLAPLFNIAGSALGDDGKVRTTFSWVVGGSLVLPAGKDTLTMTATVTDNKGGSSTTRQTVGISEVVSGQDLTPAP